MQPLLQVENLKTWFPIKKGVFARTVGYVRALDGVSLTMQAGETVGVVGESGCGKSTLARTILRLAKSREGRVLVEGKDVSRLSRKEMQEFRRTVQVVFQDPHASLNPRHTVLELLTEAPVAHGLFGMEERRERAERLLGDVGLPPDILDRYPFAFSGGQRQRICIARALALNPKLLICDEAVSALDLSIRAQVLNLLEELQEKRGLAYLFITHDIGVVEHIADRVVVMYLGKVVESGGCEEVLHSPAHPYTRLLLAAVPAIGKPLPDVPPMEAGTASGHGGCPFAPRCPQAQNVCRHTAPSLREISPGHCAACHIVG